VGVTNNIVRHEHGCPVADAADAAATAFCWHRRSSGGAARCDHGHPGGAGMAKIADVAFAGDWTCWIWGLILAC
jgi:hypothetical protein